MYSKYSVKPFVSARHERMSTDGGGDSTLSCVICGRKIGKSSVPVIIINGGDEYGDETSDKTDAGYMGEWRVGSDCHKKYKVQ